MINESNFFDQPVKNDIRIYGNIRKITIGQEDDYTTCCLLNYPYFKEHHKMTATNLSKKQALDADPTVIQPINFIGNSEKAGNTTMFFIFK